MTAGPSAFRLRLDWWLVALLSTALIVFLVHDRTAARIDNLIYDNLLRIGERAPAADILLVAIDNRSLREIGPWPWPRERHAELLRAVSKARHIGRWHRNSRIFTSYAVLASILRCGDILERAVFGSIGRYDRRLRNTGLTYGRAGLRI